MGAALPHQRCHLSGQEPVSAGSLTAGVSQRHSVKLTNTELAALQKKGDI